MIKRIIIFCLFFISAAYSQEKIKLSLEYVEKKLPFGLVEKVPANFPKITLSLSGGGSRGAAHIGVLKAFEENDIPFQTIFGTSMGSFIGGMYASGYSVSQIDSIVNNSNWNSFSSIKEVNRNELFIDQKITEEKAIFAVRLNGFNPVIPQSINTGQGVANFLNLLTLYAPLHVENNFNELLYDFKAVATDFKTAETVIFDKGSLSFALRASSSVSLVLPPIKKDSMLLVDGGLVANIPVIPARKDGADFIIASNTTSPLRSEDELNLLWEIADQMVSIPMKILDDQQLKEADIVLSPAIKEIKNNDFTKLPAVIKAGYDCAIRNMNLIKEKIKKSFLAKLKKEDQYFYRITLDTNPTEYEKEVFSDISSKEVITGNELLYELYLIGRKGIFDSLYIEVIPSGSNNILKVIAKENPLVNYIDLNGITLIKSETVHNLFSGLKGKHYNSKSILNAVIHTLSTYRSEGYPFAYVKNITFDKKTGVLSITFDELKISDLEITGNKKTDPGIIKREFVFKNGTIKYDAIQTGLENLRATNIFDNVEVSPVTIDGVNKLKVDVTEKLSTVLRVGLRVDNENMTQLSLDLRDENFFGTGSEFGLFGSAGSRSRSLTLEHKSNRVFDSYLTYKLKLFYDSRDINVYSNDTTEEYNHIERVKTGEYTQTSYGISVGLGTQVQRFGNILLETKYFNDQIVNIGSYDGPTYNIGIMSVRLSLIIDSQNKYPFPTDGFLINSYYETAQSILGSRTGYTKVYFDYKNIFSPIKSHTFTGRFIIGSADATLPLSQNFSLGGQNSFFGMHDYEFRGRQIFLASLEYRYMLPFSLFFDTYIKARYDLGSIWSEKEEIRFKDLRHGIGASLAFDTPIGPAEFSVGESFYFKNTLQNTAIVWGSPYFYFSVGYNF